MLLAQDCRGVTTIKISACVIVKNEERNLPRWLECVKAFADEIIVVDTGSEDRTVEIAKAGGAAVYYFKWCNDFSAAKNYALDKATGDWIVFLDADEYFDETGRKELRTALNRIHGNHDIIGIDSLLYNIDVDHNNHILSTANQQRVFRNIKSLRYHGRIHEHLSYQGTENVTFAAFSDHCAIYHTGYSQCLTQNKNQRNLDLLLADIKAAGGEQPEHYSYLSVSYFNLRQYDETIHYAKLAIQTADKGIKPALVKQYWLWIKSEQVKQSSNEILQQIINKALTDIPNHPDFLWEDTKLALQRRDFVYAERKILQILKQIKNKALMREYESAITGQLHIVYAALGKILETKGEDSLAIEYYRKALQGDPFKENALRDLLKLSLDRNPREIIRWLEGIYSGERERPLLIFCLKSHPRDEIYAHFMHLEKGSYEDLMGKKDYRGAAKDAAKRLSYTLGSAEYMGSDAIIDQAAAIASELILALLAMPSKFFNDCTAEYSLLPQGLQSILLRFHGNEQSLSPEDIVAYQATLEDVLQYALPDVMDRFSQLSLDFGENTLLQTAVKLYEKGRWKALLALYERIPKTRRSELPGFWYYTGICHLHLGNRETAYNHLTRAQNMGVKSPDLPSFLAWSRDTRSDKAKKTKR